MLSKFIKHKSSVRWRKSQTLGQRILSPSETLDTLAGPPSEGPSEAPDLGGRPDLLAHLDPSRCLSVHLSPFQSLLTHFGPSRYTSTLVSRSGNSRCIS